MKTILKINLENSWNISLVFCLVAALTLLPDFSYASTSSDGISTVLCTVVASLTGPIGRAVATIAVVVLGIGLFLGKLSWGLAIATAVGVGMIFSAPTIVSWLAGTNSTAGTTCATS